MSHLTVVQASSTGEELPSEPDAGSLLSIFFVPQGPPASLEPAVGGLGKHMAAVSWVGAKSAVMLIDEVVDCLCMHIRHRLLHCVQVQGAGVAASILSTPGGLLFML